MERGDGASFCLAVSIVALLFGLAVEGLAQWITDGIVAFAGTGLIYSIQAYQRAYWMNRP